MAFAQFSTLKTAIADWLMRADLTAAQLNDLVTLAHSRIFYGSRHPMFPSEPLRIRAMEASSDLTVNAQTVALPTRFLQTRRIYLNTSPISKLDFLAPQDFWAKYLGPNTGKPIAFTVEGENFVFGPSPDSSYTGKLLYYQSFAAMSADADTNWLLSNAPGAYLYGALLEGAIFTAEDQSAAKWGPMFASVIASLHAADQMDRYGGAPLMIRGDTGNP